MVGMDAEEKRVVLLEHRAQFRRDPLRQEYGDARADAQEFHVRDVAQLQQEKLQLFIAEQQRIASAQKHIKDAFGAQGVMARASLAFANFVPAYSSGVSVGISRCSCSRRVMRFFSCHCQLFQSRSATSLQNPRPAERNSFSSLSRADSESSPPAPSKI